MYCIHCGAEGAATFCAVCGRRQQVDEDAPIEAILVGPEDGDSGECTVVSEVRPASCWTTSVNYHEVLASHAPRERIRAAGQGATQGVTGEDLLAVFDAVSPIGFSLGKLTNAVLPIYDKLGIRIDKESQAVFDSPPGRVILAVLCTLAGRSLSIADVRQDTDRCALSVDLPWGLMTNPGKLHVLVMAEESGARLSIATRISGQWYDFGKSQRMIVELFDAIQSDLTSQLSGRLSPYRRVA